MKIINYKEQFIDFWKKAENKNFDEQFDLWIKEVESLDQDYFNQIIFSDNDKRIDKAKKAFIEYSEIYEDTVHLLEIFDNTFNQQLESFKEFFPDADFSTYTVRAMVSLKSFVGMADSDDQNNRWFSLSMDFLASLRRHPRQIEGLEFIFTDKVIYMHEMLHLYQGIKYPQNQNLECPSEKLMAVFWEEGLANYFSQVSVPGTSNDAAIGLIGVEKFYRDNYNSVHKALLEDLSSITKESFVKQNAQWWALTKHSKDFPFLIGYAVSRNFIEFLIKDFTFEEILNFNIDLIKKNLYIFLKNTTKN